jgi:type II secretory pathway predicted ATPase ExeA
MSRTPVELMEKLREVETPDYQTVAAKANEFLARTGLAPQDLASRLGIGESTLRLFIYGKYGESNGAPRDTQFICARVWPFIASHWPKEEAEEPGRLLETKGYRKIRECLEEAIDDGAISILYGPPSSEKSFVLENLCAQFSAAGRQAVYMYCGPRTRPTGLLREIARSSEVWLRSNYYRPHMEALRGEFISRANPPALVFDEAQHLSVETLETIRELHDRTRRPGRKGCGVILAGSHDLHRDFESASRRSSLEQWLSRISYRIQLEGMTKDEALTIAGRAFGNGRPAKLSEAQQEVCLKRCTVMDAYANPPRAYFSSRRLLEYIRQQKKNVKSVLAENVA